MNNKEKEFTRTTLWLPRSLHEEAKIMAILTRTNLSMFIRAALLDKIKKVRENNATHLSKRDI